MLITIRLSLCLIFLLSLSGCGSGGEESTSSAPNDSSIAYLTAAEYDNSNYGVFTTFTSARALSFKVSGITLVQAYAENDSVMAVNYEQNKIAIVSTAAWQPDEPVLRFYGSVTGKVLLSNIEQLSGSFKILPPLVEVRAIR